MSKYLVEESTLTDIADAIREQTGDENPIMLSSFADAISGISGGNHEYSTDEQVVGTWIDGSVIYERTFEFQSQLTVSSSNWTSSGISADGIEKIMGVELFGVSNYQGGGLANIQNNVIMLQTTRNSDAYVKEFLLRYTKASASLLSMNSTESEGSENE